MVIKARRLEKYFLWGNMTAKYRSMATRKRLRVETPRQSFSIKFVALQRTVPKAPWMSHLSLAKTLVSLSGILPMVINKSVAAILVRRQFRIDRIWPPMFFFTTTRTSVFPHKDSAIITMYAIALNICAIKTWRSSICSEESVVDIFV